MEHRRSLKIKVSELAHRLNGFSLPWFGVQWTAPPDERYDIRAFLVFLEDRRVIYSPYELEVQGQVEMSIQQIRAKCTETLSLIKEDSPATGPIRAIRAACRRFLDVPRSEFHNLYTRDFGDFKVQAAFFTSLGEFRALIGIQIAFLALRYQIELESELVSILPLGDELGSQG